MNGWRLVGGILLDVAGLVAGSLAGFWAFYGMYEGTKGDFWFIRLTMMVPSAVVMALLSSLLRHDVPWRCWLRFALFELMTLLLLVMDVEHDWGKRFLYAGYWEGVIHLVLSLLLDAAVYAVALNVWRLGRPLKRLARGGRLTTACPGPR
ncbi:hypothetical protein HPC49_07135 [Pyxidicoccus fallax]|uniref:Uncharacterized protein n=1 Tax=Pyxidicoccus fallax TaxID=394095 RepID=A0A848LMC2_9BACT|nr:hypothetical protein [Pyxidicoccus fallax]NMO18820.1 hypothetical protein [Pyxidicoccus fallax]NPC78025.1 hypothetical protein [Pyxidicoccus fallax]